MDPANKADIFGSDIYDAVMKEHRRLGLVIVNRMISFDYTRIFKETSLDYAGNCVLVERLFLREGCKTTKCKVQKLPDEASDIRNQILGIAYDATRPDMSEEGSIKKLEEADELALKLSSFELEDAEVDLLTYSPFEEDDNPIVVLDLSDDDVSLKQYKSFCNQMAYFAFNYFSAMIMVPSAGIELEVVPIMGTTYIDIVAKIKG